MSSPLGGVTARESLEDGDEYTVVSQVARPDERTLRVAGDDFPDAIEDRYTQLPSNTPDELEEFTDRIVEDANTPYAVVTRVESWLETNKEYSLDVERPDDNVAWSFVSEMEAGYCTYFATAMVAMLRTQGVPSRLAVGYTPGQRVDRNRWVVRGYNAHTWVEVFFPGVGWVRFDPTPADPRQQAQQDRLDQARRNDADGVDTDGSRNTWTPTPTPTPVTPTDTPETPTPVTPTPSTPGTPDQPDGPNAITPPGGTSGGDGPALPSRRSLLLGLVVLIGAVAGARRARLLDRLRLAGGTYLQRSRTDPPTDVRRAAARAERVLSRRRRPRRPDESRPAYFRAMADIEDDDRLRRLARIYERAVYADEVDREDAEAAIAAVDGVVRSRLPLPARD